MPQIIVLNRRDDFLSREITRIMTGFLAMSSRQKEWNGGFKVRHGKLWGKKNAFRTGTPLERADAKSLRLLR